MPSRFLGYDDVTVARSTGSHPEGHRIMSLGCWHHCHAGNYSRGQPGAVDLFCRRSTLRTNIAARVVETAVAAIPYADAVSITGLSGLLPVPRPRTHERGWNSITSSTRQAGVRAAKPRGSAPRCAQSWRRTPTSPEFVEAAQRVGNRASLSVPRLIDDQAKSRNLSATQHPQPRPHPRSIRSTRNL